MKSGLAIFVVTMIVLVAATFAPSIHAEAYDRYKLVSESVSGNYKTCIYRNTRGETKSTSINKGKRCPSTY